MKNFKVFVGKKDGFSSKLKSEVYNLGLREVKKVREFTVYWFSGISKKYLAALTQKALHNPILQNFYIDEIPSSLTRGARKVEIISNPGVIDPREPSVKKAAFDLGVRGDLKVKFGRLYLLYGKIDSKKLATVKNRLLMKPVIEHEVAKNEQVFLKPASYKFEPIEVPITSASDKRLLEISQSGGLSLTLEEMKAIQEYFKKLGRESTDVELETIAQTWSEHCSHKSLKGSVIHNGERIGNLLKRTIIDPSLRLNKKYVVSAFTDNAGGIKVGNQVVSVKVETHNHPSAIEPVGGAETGTGGVIRDILGFGKGAKPASSIVCFGVGPQNLSYNKLPKGVLHPKAILSGVVEGTKSYGNQMGIPTDFFQDSLLIHKNYVVNPLVYCGTVGITDLRSAKKIKPKAGDLVVLLGGLTGRDGIHGATFSSAKLQKGSEVVSGGAVQIGDAIMEKKVLDAILELRDEKVTKWVTDCGGGGLSSAVGETGSKIGVRVDLDRVPKKYEGLSYTEIWISESQERMIVVIDPRDKSRVLRICKKHQVPFTVIGKFTGKGRLELFYQNKKVADLEMTFLHGGCPRVTNTSFWKPKTFSERGPRSANPSSFLLKLLENPDIGSKSFFANQYDSTVQGRTILGPLAGFEETVHQDVTVKQISPDSLKGLAISIAANPTLTVESPRKMSHWVIVQTLAKLAAAGADVTEAALLDNFSWGSPKKPKVMGELVESLLGCKDAVENLKVPFISGKDSLNNEYKGAKGDISIPGTLLITAIAPLVDVRKVVAGGFKEEGNLIFLIGNVSGKSPTEIDLRKGRELLIKVSKLARSGVLESAASIGKGGLGVTLSKMCLLGNVGAEVDLKNKKTEMLFSEWLVGFVVEIRKEKVVRLKKELSGIPVVEIGVIGGDKLKVSVRGQVVSQSLERLWKSYSKNFRDFYEA